MTLPMHCEVERPSFATAQSVSEYLRRTLQYAQMDIDYTFAQMLHLCRAPRKVYQLTSYRKQTKNQWARDDPAFVVALIFFLSIASFAYGIALQVSTASCFRIVGLFVGCHFVGFGMVIATVLWFVSNNYLRVKSFHGVEQQIEWMYAFDIHCNSFFPLFLLLYVIHYFLLPFLIQPTFMAALVSNALYAGALCYYCYITSLGYSTLPFLEKTEIFLYPCWLIVVIFVFASLLGVNFTRISLASLTA